MPSSSGKEDHTCDVTAWTGVTLHPSCCNRVLTCISHHDGDGAGRCPSGSDRRRSNGNDNIGLRRVEVDRQSRKALVGIIRREDLNAEIASFHESEPRQFREVQLTEDTCAELVGGQQADPPYLLRRLRKERSGEQRHGQRTEQEVSSPHRITSHRITQSRSYSLPRNVTRLSTEACREAGVVKQEGPDLMLWTAPAQR